MYTDIGSCKSCWKQADGQKREVFFSQSLNLRLAIMFGEARDEFDSGVGGEAK